MILVSLLSNHPRFFALNILIEAADLLPNLVERPIEAARRQSFLVLSHIVFGRWYVADHTLLIFLNHGYRPLHGVTQFVSQFIVIDCFEPLPAEVAILIAGD